MAAPIDIRAKVAGWRAAAQAAELAREQSLGPSELLAVAEELRELNPTAFERPDPVREREIEAVRNAWKVLRARWRRDDASSPRP